jgi:hypothetical protein
MIEEAGASSLPFILEFAVLISEPERCSGATKETRIDRETTDDD